MLGGWEKTCFEVRAEFCLIEGEKRGVHAVEPECGVGDGKETAVNVALLLRTGDEGRGGWFGIERARGVFVVGVDC